MSNTIKPGSVGVRVPVQSSTPAAAPKPAAQVNTTPATSNASSSFSSGPATNASTARALGNPDAPLARTAAPTASSQSAATAEANEDGSVRDTGMQKSADFVRRNLSTHLPMSDAVKQNLDKLTPQEKQLWTTMHDIGTGNKSMPSGLSDQQKAIWNLGNALENDMAKMDDLGKDPLKGHLEKAVEGMSHADAKEFVSIVRGKAVRNMVRKAIAQDMVMMSFMAGQKPG